MGIQESAERPFVPSHTQRSPAVDKDLQQKEFEKKIKSLRMDMAITFSTPEGIKVLKWLFKQSGYDQTQIGGNQAIGLDVKDGTFYNAARESIYIELRKLIPHEILKKVEFENVEEELI